MHIIEISRESTGTMKQFNSAAAPRGVACKPLSVLFPFCREAAFGRCFTPSSLNLLPSPFSLLPSSSSVFRLPSHSTSFLLPSSFSLLLPSSVFLLLPCPPPPPEELMAVSMKEKHEGARRCGVLCCGCSAIAGGSCSPRMAVAAVPPAPAPAPCRGVLSGGAGGRGRHFRASPPPGGGCQSQKETAFHACPQLLKIL